MTPVPENDEDKISQEFLEEAKIDFDVSVFFLILAMAILIGALIYAHTHHLFDGMFTAIGLR